jgi:hypothetical protein
MSVVRCSGGFPTAPAKRSRNDGGSDATGIHGTAVNQLEMFQAGSFDPFRQDQVDFIRDVTGKR